VKLRSILRIESVESKIEKRLILRIIEDREENGKECC
jgi:hypothetical protein